MLIEWILSASALTAAVLLLRAVFRRRVSQKLMYALWLPVLLRLLLPVPLFHSRYTVSGAAVLLETRPAPAAHASVIPTPGPDIVPARPTGEPVGDRASAPAVTPTPAPASPRPASQAPAARPAAAPRPLDLWAILTRLWLAGSVAAGLWLLWVNLSFARRLRRSRQEFRREGVPVYVSPEVASPCLFGLPRPAVYLTPACAEGPEEARAQVLLHEETHRKQGDHVWGCLRCLCLAVWWWNPLVWLAALCSRRDGELCCDEKVMQLLGEEGRLTYGHTLVDLVPARAPRPFLSAATLSGGARAMKERLDRIVKKPRLWAAAAALALALAILAAACTFGGRPEAGGGSPAVSPRPSATPEVTPTPQPDAVPILEAFQIDAEEVTELGYRFFPFGERSLKRGDEGFTQALDLLRSLWGTPSPLPKRSVDRELTLDGKRLTLQYDGEKLYATTNLEDNLLLDTQGRPDDELEAIFERFGAGGPELTVQDHTDYVQDGTLTLSLAQTQLEYEAVREAVAETLRRFYEPGPEAGTSTAEGAVLPFSLSNRGGEDADWLPPALELYREGAWYRVPERQGLAITLERRMLSPGQTLEEGLSLATYDDPLSPGRYRLALTYGVGEAGSRAKSYDHIAFAEFEIAESAPGPEGTIHPTLPASIQEIVLSGSGKTVTVTDSGTIRELAGAVEQLEFRPDPEGDMNKPGAISLSLDFVTPSGTETVTLPSWLRDGAVYSAGADSIRLFGKYLGEGGEAPGPEAAPEAALLLEPVNTRWIVALTYENAPEGGLSLREEGEGFREALDLFLSLRGTPCGAPQEILKERQFALNRLYGAWRIGLAWDGEALYALWDDAWYRLENAGRADLELEALFEDYGSRNLLLVPEDHSGLIEDGSMTIAPEQTVFSLETILACRDLVQEKLDRGETPREEDYAGALLRLTLQNRADEPIQPQIPELAAWRDGVWYALDYEFSRYAIGYVISPGGSLADGVPLTAIAPEHLLPGLYRVCVPYRLGEEGNGADHAAYCEFEITGGYFVPSIAPEPTPTPAPVPAPEPTARPWEPVTAEMGTDWLTLPEGARWLTPAELTEWEAWFDAHWMRRQFLRSAYEGPEDVDLGELFYNGVDTEESAAMTFSHPITDEDVRASLLHLGWWETEFPTDKLPRQEMDAVLRRYLGLGLEETRRVGLSWPYFPETDCYYHAHGDTNYGVNRLLCGYVQGEEISLFYEGSAPYYGGEYPLGYTYKGNIYRVRLRTEGEDVRFLSNLRVLTDGAALSFDPPQPAPAVPLNETGDYGRDVTVIPPRVWEDFESYEAARDSLDEISHTFGEDVYPFERKLEQEYPGYGTLVYGEVGTGTAHGPDDRIYFITEAGRRYELYVPGYMMGEYGLTDWEGANEGRGFYLLGDASRSPILVTWWMNCAYETYIGSGESRRGGSCFWTLYLPTMEVFAWFRPEG